MRDWPVVGGYYGTKFFVILEVFSSLTVYNYWWDLIRDSSFIIFFHISSVVLYKICHYLLGDDVTYCLSHQMHFADMYLPSSVIVVHTLLPV
jgi:hypothetical protein